MFETILLVDDHPAVLEGIRNVVTGRYPGATCRTASSLAEALSVTADWQPRLAIVDLSIGGGSGIPLIAELRSKSSSIRILTYTLHSESEFGGAAVQAGADGYITKDRPLSEFMEALSRLEAGDRYIPAKLGELLAATPVNARRLSVREEQTLRMLAEGLATKEVAAVLGVSIKTVSTYRARLLEKLGLTTTADLIRYADSHPNSVP